MQYKSFNQTNPSSSPANEGQGLITILINGCVALLQEGRETNHGAIYSKLHHIKNTVQIYMVHYMCML